MPVVWRIFELRVSVWLRDQLIFQRVCRFTQPLQGSPEPGPLQLLFLVREINIDWATLGAPDGYANFERIPPEEVDQFITRYLGISTFSSSFIVDEDSELEDNEAA